MSALMKFYSKNSQNLALKELHITGLKTTSKTDLREWTSMANYPMNKL
jgi:hypothetical protein